MAVRDSYPQAASGSSSTVQGKRKRTTKSMYEGDDDDDPLGWTLADEGDRTQEDLKCKGKAKAKPKRAKKEDKPDKEPEEKRLARVRKSCPKAVEERAERVMSQRMFLVDRDREGDELMEEFQILGSTGNIYTVTIGLLPACSCPDSAKNGTCKHIIFVMLKVLCVPTGSSLWYQKALLTPELASIFAAAPLSPISSALASGAVRQAYREAEGIETQDKFGDLKGSGGIPEKKIPEEGDDCPICYDDLSATDPQLTYCLGAGGCGRPIHNECLGQWIRTQQGLGKEVTCCWCRTKLMSGSSGSTGKATQDGIYTNLAHLAGMSSQRDTSSYYTGPRRGESYNSYTVSQRVNSYQSDRW